MEGWVNPGQVLNPGPLTWRSAALPTELAQLIRKSRNMTTGQLEGVYQIQNINFRNKFGKSYRRKEFWSSPWWSMILQKSYKWEGNQSQQNIWIVKEILPVPGEENFHFTVQDTGWDTSRLCKFYLVTLKSTRYWNSGKCPMLNNMPTSILEWDDILRDTEIFKLPTLVYKRCRGDIKEVYKILKSLHDKQAAPFMKQWIEMADNRACRGFSLNSSLKRANKPIQPKSFGICVVTVWNNLPNCVIQPRQHYKNIC